MKKQILFIVNPIAGDIKKANLPNLIREHLDHKQYSYEIAYTKQAGNATHLAKEAVNNKVDIVVAVGGDGSINEIARAIVNTDLCLAIIPLGSGNGLAYHLDLPIKNIKKALEIINTGKPIHIDTLKTNKGDVVSFAGIGLEALAARTYRHLGLRGFLAYTIATVKSIFFQYTPQVYQYNVDGQAHAKEIYLFTIYNARYLGYKVGKVEQASLADGYMDLIVIQSFPMWKVLWIAILELIGKMYLAKECTIYRAKSLKIVLDKKSAIQLDGDSNITSSDFEIEVNPLSLKVLVSPNLNNY
ncbi:MAG: YegS/Rv2252/BmrU family lipid kinase [Bacteroidetes bacterium]|nr:YegS/Rv2252/BmrU family lipid kinase [Bacteroidota bacterium]